jgi:hypothetical protein
LHCVLSYRSIIGIVEVLSRAGAASWLSDVSDLVF